MLLKGQNILNLVMEEVALREQRNIAVGKLSKNVKALNSEFSSKFEAHWRLFSKYYLVLFSL